MNLTQSYCTSHFLMKYLFPVIYPWRLQFGDGIKHVDDTTLKELQDAHWMILPLAKEIPQWAYALTSWLFKTVGGAIYTHQLIKQYFPSAVGQCLTDTLSSYLLFT